MNLLNSAFVTRIKRNHGLEHATLHVLALQCPHEPLAGYSDGGGFWILGKVSTENLTVAVQEALRRLKGGEWSLALHPNCGTSLLTTGALVGSAAFLALIGSGQTKREKLDRLPLAIVLSTIAVLIAQPLGLFLQDRLSTSSELTGIKSFMVVLKKTDKPRLHRISIKYDAG